jgi:hypothetical protein
MTSANNLNLLNSPLTYLTNGDMEDCGHVSKSYFLEHKIPYGEFEGEFYPLTQRELSFLGSESMPEIPFQLMGGYSAILESKKYIAIAFEVSFSKGTTQEARATSKELGIALLDLAKDLSGAKIYIDNDVSYEGFDGCGFFEVNLYIPFDTVFSIASNYDVWVSYLQPLLKSAIGHLN